MITCSFTLPLYVCIYIYDYRYFDSLNLTEADLNDVEHLCRRAKIALSLAFLRR